MNTKMRNLTLTAAALAALTVVAPNASAQQHPRGGGQGNAPRPGAPSDNGGRSGGSHGNGSHGNSGHGGSGSYGRGSSGNRGAYGGYRGAYGYGHVAPYHPYVRYGYGYAAPFRVFSGFRFYSAFPGAGYVYIANYGWVLPPFFGAVWVPAHYDIEGNWIEGFWR